MACHLVQVLALRRSVVHRTVDHPAARASCLAKAAAAAALRCFKYQRATRPTMSSIRAPQPAMTPITTPRWSVGVCEH
eukprot:12061-Heterococcus_DN1.PRE.3